MEIVITGTVGVGKSTISTTLFKKLKEQNVNVHKYDEMNDNNPYLSYYYDNRPGWSFIIQIDYLMSRFHSMMKNRKTNQEEDIVGIYDRHFLDDLIFANLKAVKEDMSSLQWNAYKILNDELTKKVYDQKPDFVFLLKAPFESIYKRVVGRSREEEANVDIDYWKNLYYQYYENPETLNYLKNNTNKLVIIDAAMPIEEITNNIIEEIKKEI